MAWHIPPHEKADKQGEMPLHILSPIPKLLHTHQSSNLPRILNTTDT